MTQQAELLREIDRLPPKYFGEVIDFVGYLQKKARQDDINDKAVSTDTEWRNPLFGLAKTKGATLTLDRFMKMQQEEIDRENENDQRLWGKK